MPIYDYRCDHCGHAFSAVRSFGDDQIPACPSCGGEPRKLMSQTSIVFKGSGWYKTDSRAPAKATKDGEKSGDGKPAEAKEGPKTDAQKAGPKEAAS
ncbi:MAG TPA: FmdB family zinc ribbon protein [Candidatus Limnocylindria bacterium]|nr:FmdB family zinc ribbon protein [Candidatus Limnocylindria bacterium]